MCTVYLFSIRIHHITVNGSRIGLGFILSTLMQVLFNPLHYLSSESSVVPCALSLFLSVGTEYVNQSKRGSPYVPLLSPAAFFPALTLLLVYSNTPPLSHTACTEMLDSLHVEEDYFI